MSSLNIKRSELEAAPERPWDQISEYDSIYLLPTKKKHDSGWHLICIVGRNGKTLEKAAWCDDIGWLVVDAHDRIGSYLYTKLRSDMTYPAGVMHFWGRGIRFRVGVSLSSTDVEVVGAPNAGATVEAA